MEKIFRPYDIRGIYPKEINEEVAYLIGQAFGVFLAKGKRSLNIVVGRDNRLSSNSLFKFLAKGITDQGGMVIDIGHSTTPMLYWACGHFKFDGGIEITASHLPADYNGFKLVREKAIPISQKTGLKEIEEIVIRKKFPRKKKGKIIAKKIISDYLEFNLKDFEIPKFKNLKLAIDTANAISGILIPYLRKKLPLKIYSLFEKLDGSFPNHPPNPLIKENLRPLQKLVKNKKPDLAVAFDGDGDRIIFIDEKGKIIPGDLILALISDLILGQREKILFDIRSSNVVKETIEKKGGKALVSRIGHSFIKEKMRKENIFFGGEFSGHYYHSAHYFSEAPLFVLFKILEALSQREKSLSDLMKPYQKYFHSGEINFEVKNKEAILKKLEKKFPKGKISKIDGLRVDFKDWWFLARPSGTEDILRLVIEAKSKKLMAEKKNELTTLIRGKP